MYRPSAEVADLLFQRLHELAQTPQAKDLPGTLEAGAAATDNLLVIRFHALRRIDDAGLPDDVRSEMRDVLLQLTDVTS